MCGQVLSEYIIGEYYQKFIILLALLPLESLHAYAEFAFRARRGALSL